MSRLAPLAAFDIDTARATPVADPWPALESAAGYRWLHLDMNGEGARDWIRAHLPDIAARSLLQAETRPRCERFEGGLILNLRGVNLNPESDPEDMVSLRIWATDRTIVSVRVRKVWAADALKQAAETGTAPDSVGRFLARLAYELTTRIETVSLAMEENTDQLEDMVADERPLPPGKLPGLRQAVIKMRRFIHPQRDAVATLAGLDDWVLSPDDLALLRETANRTRRTVEELDATRDRLSALQEHLEAERGQALARNSYVLSVVAAIFLPLGFLTGLFGLNVAGMPGTDTPAAFAILAVASAAIGLALFVVFKWARWL